MGLSWILLQHESFYYSLVSSYALPHDGIHSISETGRKYYEYLSSVSRVKCFRCVQRLGLHHQPSSARIMRISFAFVVFLTVPRFAGAAPGCPFTAYGLASGQLPTLNLALLFAPSTNSQNIQADGLPAAEPSSLEVRSDVSTPVETVTAAGSRSTAAMSSSVQCETCSGTSSVMDAGASNGASSLPTPRFDPSNLTVIVLNVVSMFLVAASTGGTLAVVLAFRYLRGIRRRLTEMQDDLGRVKADIAANVEFCRMFALGPPPCSLRSQTESSFCRGPGGMPRKPSSSICRITASLV
ncbi:hypothetical protein F5I97DRAFT_1833686 [Phlebopus sp. FC_14]|nr:hypothetical protein F5I97DRAFT_1833686 [Phlebopus sp. FC_14]